MEGVSRDLESIAEGYLSARRRGEKLTVDDVIRQHPGQSDEIRELFPVLEMLEEAAETVSDGPGLPDTVRELGDYRVVRELGRGGMGVVYEAVQKSLDRRVALKVLPGPAQLDPQRARRFRREAQAAARLRHPNIVPVFEVGEEQGVQYYAMQLIEGKGLDRVIGEVSAWKDAASEDSGGTASATARLALKLLRTDLEDPTVGSTAERHPDEVNGAVRSTGIDGRYFRNVARLGVQVARALSYAHSEGILHRDLKPSNLLLDGDGTPWITDFGLARHRGSEEITGTGDVLGTPRYLAPEALRGWSDPGTDVWGLGVTLYELLTLRPAIPGKDRAELLRRILEHVPEAPRRIDPRIPRDLETIVLTAIQKDPARRYTTAADLADDLRRFLDGLPILARRPRLHHRAGLFLRRHRLAVGAAAVAVGVLIVVLVAWAFTLRAARDQEVLARRALEQALHRETDARAQAEAQGRRAEQNFHLAREAVDRTLEKIGAERLVAEPRMQHLRREVLEDVANFYREFLALRGDDPEVRRDAGLAWARLAETEFALDRREEAEAHLRRAEELLGGVAVGSSLDEDRVRLADVQLQRARVMFTEFRFDEVERILDPLLHLLAEVDEAASTRYVVLRMSVLQAASKLFHATRRTAEALALTEQAFELGTRRLARISVPDITGGRLRQELLGCLGQRARIAQAQGRLNQAEEDLLRARVMATAMELDITSLTRQRWSLAQIELGLAGLQRRQGRLEEAEDSYRRSLAIYDHLVADFETFGEFLADRAEARTFLGLLLHETGRLEEARTSFETSIADGEALKQTDKASIEGLRQLASTYVSLGNLQWSCDRTEEARVAYEQAVTQLEELAREVPQFREYEDGLASLALARGNLGHLLLAIGQTVPGEALLRQALETYGALAAASPEHSGHWEKYALFGRALARQLRATGEIDAALDLLMECRDLLEEALGREPDASLLQRRLAEVCISLGNLLRSEDALDEAEDTLFLALELREQALAERPDRPEARSELAGALNDLALLSMARGDYDEAEELLRQAIDEQEHAIQTSPRSSFRRWLATHHLNLAVSLGKTGQYEEAVAAARRAAELRPNDAQVMFEVSRQMACSADPLTGAARTARCDRALEYLARAVDAGFRDVTLLDTDPVLEPLRERVEFQELLRRLRRP